MSTVTRILAMDMMRAHQDVCGGGCSRSVEDSRIAEEVAINR